MTCRGLLFASLGLASLAGCAAGPAYERPAAPSSPALESGAFLRAQGQAQQAPVAAWWTTLEDPVLTGLIETGLAQAPAVEAAQARIRRARSGIAGARAALLPALSSSATYIYADFPNQSFGAGGGPTDFVTLGFDTQWEIDLWGGKSREVERARADAGAAEAELAGTLVSLSAEIARTYVTLRAREDSERLLDRRRMLELQLLDMALRRRKGGTTNEQEVAAARQILGGSDAELAAIRSEIAVLRDALAVLSGKAPGTMDGLAKVPIPMPPAELAIGDPAAMLARRPDVLAAERRLAAATAGIGMAQARRFPQVSLLGLIGIGGSDFGDVFDASDLSTIAVPRLSWNFLDFGRNAAAVEGAQASRDAAMADYRASVLGALQDAEASLSRFSAARIALARAGDGLHAAREISRLERLRGDAGAISQSQASEAEKREIDSELAAINSRANLTLAYIALAKSLGLGWQTQLPTEN